MAEQTHATRELRVAGPWDALLHTPPAPRLASSNQARDGSKLAGLLTDLTQRGTATTAALAAHAGLTTRQVWGLLKAPRACGQVCFKAGRWTISKDFAGRAVERAAALLRSQGWSVEPPNGSHS